MQGYDPHNRPPPALPWPPAVVLHRSLLLPAGGALLLHLESAGGGRGEAGPVFECCDPLPCHHLLDINLIQTFPWLFRIHGCTLILRGRRQNSEPRGWGVVKLGLATWVTPLAGVQVRRRCLCPMLAASARIGQVTPRLVHLESALRQHLAGTVEVMLLQGMLPGRAPSTGWHDCVQGPVLVLPYSRRCAAAMGLPEFLFSCLGSSRCPTGLLGANVPESCLPPSPALLRSHGRVISGLHSPVQCFLPCISGHCISGSLKLSPITGIWLTRII